MVDILFQDLNHFNLLQNGIFKESLQTLKNSPGSKLEIYLLNSKRKIYIWIFKLIRQVFRFLLLLECSFSMYNLNIKKVYRAHWNLNVIKKVTMNCALKWNDVSIHFYSLFFHSLISNMIMRLQICYFSLIFLRLFSVGWVMRKCSGCIIFP